MSQRNRSGASGPDASRKVNATLGATTINSYTSGTITFAFSNARTTDLVLVNPKAAMTAGLSLAGAYVSASGVVTLTVANATAAAANLGTLNVDACLIRFSV